MPWLKPSDLTNASRGTVRQQAKLAVSAPLKLQVRVPLSLLDRMSVYMRQVTIFLFLACALFVTPLISAEPSSISIRGKTIRIGDTADSTFETLKPNDSKKKDIEPDPTNPRSLVVTHYYEVDGKAFSLSFARTTDPGPYRLIRISASSPEKASIAHPATPPCLTEKQILKARSKYKVEVLSFDASKRYGSEFPFSDFVRLRVANSSSVVLPFLTVRANRYSKGAEVGWSRAPSIPVGDLKPGQSKEINYYPKGHLDVVPVDRISVQIEKKFPSKTGIV